MRQPEAVVNEFKLLESKALYKNYENLFDTRNAETFWYKVGTLKNHFNEYLYKNLYEFVANIMTFPHSSASAERVFSKLALMKNKLTNRLKVTTCESMLSALNLVENELENWTPSAELIHKYRNEVSKKEHYFNVQQRYDLKLGIPNRT